MLDAAEVELAHSLEGQRSTDTPGPIPVPAGLQLMSLVGADTPMLVSCPWGFCGAWFCPLGFRGEGLSCMSAVGLWRALRTDTPGPIQVPVRLQLMSLVGADTPMLVRLTVLDTMNALKLVLSRFWTFE